MAKFNYNQFRTNISADFSAIELAVHHLGNFKLLAIHNSQRWEHDEDIRLEEQNLKYWIKRVEVKILYAYECLGLLESRQLLFEELKPHKSKYEHLDYESSLDYFYSPLVEIYTRHLDAILSQIKIEEPNTKTQEKISKHGLVKQIINGTPKLLTDLQIIPHNENIIRNAAYNVLVHVFPDTVKEQSISKVTKTYKPDIGIRSLKTAIEYKFVDSKEEAKKAIGGIFEDIGGYGGSEDWKIFYAVIYMTDNFLTQDQINTELKIAKAPKNWRLITLYGKGKRRKKA